uniref:Reverse transcriptase domain-containing protein n=1 Tax=Tanacetum cinerariifolium TaxID=118510 RepID=A0A6L2M6U5_TANCI|nr:reverse transcriptase domain-containing protein [Tanacetum cinerariifolium]
MTFDPKVDGPSTNKVVENDQNLDVEGVNDESHFYDSVDWLMSDEEIDASGNSDDQRTPIPQMPWIHVNSYKLDLQVTDATAKITSSDDHRIKRKRRQYRPKVKNISRATPIPPAPPSPPPRDPSLAQAPAPVQGQKSLFQIMFKKPRKATHIPFVTTTVPPPPPPPPSRSLFPNFFTSRNKIKNIPSSKNSKLPPLPPTGPPSQPEPQRQRYDQQSSICSSSESSYLPPPLPPLNMPEMKDKYYGDFVRLGSYSSNTSSSPDLQPMGQPPTFIKDWMNMTDEAMDASGNSDDQRTPTPPPVPWIHVNYIKPDPQPADLTGVPRHIAKHRLNVRKGCSPVRQRKEGKQLIETKQYRKKLGNLWRRLEDVCRFQRLKQSMPKRWLSATRNRLEGRIPVRIPFQMLIGCIQRLSSNTNGKRGQRKTAFITSQGIFCYTKMPFGLRNAGATYQRLVDKAFHKQFSRNLKVYVDDLVIKSRTKDEIVRDIEEAFKTLRDINMKLNSKTCTFGVEEEMFLIVQDIISLLDLIFDRVYRMLVGACTTANARLNSWDMPFNIRVSTMQSTYEGERIEGPMIIEAEIGGHCIHRIYVDGGSASEILYEHCFNRLRQEIKNQLVPAISSLIGFSGEIIWPIGKIQLLVRIRDEEHSASARMNFMVVRSPSPYNRIIRRP